MISSWIIYLRIRDSREVRELFSGRKMDFIFQAVRFVLPPYRKKGSESHLTIVRLEEGEWKDGIWEAGRVLNGDELNGRELKDMAETKYMKVCIHKPENT